MSFVVTGSSGHLGEALVRVLRESGQAVRGIDIAPSAFTDHVGSVADAGFVRESLKGAQVVLHTATLHKPHVATHSETEFVQTNIQGTLNLLEEARKQQLKGVVFTSTTSTFGASLTPAENEPSVWVTEDLKPTPKNIYGVTKVAAEDLCELHSKIHGLPTLVLKTSRFFLEEDDDKGKRSKFDDQNLKTNEFLNRRVEISDVVEAHLLAVHSLGKLGFGRFIISATTPFKPEDVRRLRGQAHKVLAERLPEAQRVYRSQNWELPQDLGRVYVNDKARRELAWQPKYNFSRALENIEQGAPIWSELALKVGTKGYHGGRVFSEGPYPVCSG